MCSIDSKHSPSITLTSYFCKVFHPIKIGISFSLYPFSIPVCNFIRGGYFAENHKRKHAFYHFKKSVAFDSLIWFWLSKSSFFHFDSHVFFQYIPKKLSNITGIISIAHPSFRKITNLLVCVFLSKIFYATKVPKSFKIFGTKPTFLLITGLYP